MLSIDPMDNTERENYKLLTGSIIPRPIAFVTSVADDGTINGAPFSYFNIVSSNPPMISLSIQRQQGKQKDTARNILAGKEFVVHIVDEQNVEKVNETAASLPADQSEISLANLTLVDSDKVNIPGGKEAKVRFECSLEHSIELGGVSDQPGADLIIGKILQYHIDETIIFDDKKIDPDKLQAVSRLAGINYAKVGEVFPIERPK